MLGPIFNTYRSAFRGLPREVWLLAAVALINRSGSMVLPFLGLYLSEDRGFSVTGTGRILAAYGLGAIAGSWLGGWLSDRFGATRTQVASLAASGLGFIVFPLLESPAAIAGGAFLLSVIVDSLRPAAMADMAHRTPPELHARAFALLRLAVNLGMGAGPAIGGVLARYDYDWLFLLDAVTCWMAAVVLFVTLGRSEPDVPSAAAEEPDGRSPWRDGPFLLLLLYVVCLASAFFQIFGTLPLYFHRVYRFREDEIGFLLAVNAALIVAFEMVLIHMLEGRSKMALTGLGSFLVCAGLGLMPFGSSLPFVLMTIVIWTFGEMLALPMTNVIVALRAGRRQRGRYMGLYTMAFSVAFVVAPAAGTWVYERFGPATLWYAIGLIGFALSGGALALRRAFRG